MKAFGRFVKNVYEQEAKKFFLFLLLFILIGALILSFVLMVFSSVLGGSGFILGTYTAQDYDLSEAEKYYTKLAWDIASTKPIVARLTNNSKNSSFG